MQSTASAGDLMTDPRIAERRQLEACRNAAERFVREYDQSMPERIEDAYEALAGLHDELERLEQLAAAARPEVA